ncbi:MAG: hypothetical protein PHR56_09765 [Dehalococcoidales bacterium]|nr:hypothetical protein [Dehalococcoidales bacterium]
MFEKFVFSQKQIDKYYQSALRDFNIAKKSDVPEISFRFSYDSLLKLAITMCAAHSLRVKSKQGHHIELIYKLSELLGDKEIEIIGNEMRSKRNWDLYDGGVLISEKDSKEYVGWIKSTFEKVDELIYKEKNPQKKLI